MNLNLKRILKDSENLRLYYNFYKIGKASFQNVLWMNMLDNILQYSLEILSCKKCDAI